MIQTICVERVLREAVASPYRVLVTRPTGVAVRSGIQAVLAETDCDVVLLDFSNVALLDFSCADEVIAKLLLALDRTRRHYVALSGLREEQSEAIDHVLRHHRLVVPALPPDGGEPALLGWTSDDTRAAFDCVLARGPVTVPALADALGWSPLRAADALEFLAHHRLVRPLGPTFHPLPIL